MGRRPRTPTDNSKALAHVARKRPGFIIPSSGHVLVSSSSGADPVAQKLPSRDEIDTMICDDILEHYRLTAKSCNVAANGVFDERAIKSTADEFGRSSHDIKRLLRAAGHGRGKLTSSSG